MPAAGFLPLPTSREAHRPRPTISEEAVAVVVVSVRRPTGLSRDLTGFRHTEKYRPELVRAMKDFEFSEGIRRASVSVLTGVFLGH